MNCMNVYMAFGFKVHSPSIVEGTTKGAWSNLRSFRDALRIKKQIVPTYHTTPGQEGGSHERSCQVRPLRDRVHRHSGLPGLCGDAHLIPPLTFYHTPVKNARGNENGER